MFDQFLNFFDKFQLFDLIYLTLTILSLIKCSSKGFVLSVLSASKWLFSYVVALYLFPKIKPFKCRRIITISHAEACLDKLMESCQNLFNQGENFDFLCDEPIELIVIYKDSEDYQESDIGNNWKIIE